MERLDVSVGEAREDVDLNRQAVVFDDGAIPVGVVSKELLCVGNRGKKNPNVQLVAKEDDVFSVRSNPSVVTLSKGMACLLEDSHSLGHVKHT